MRELTVLESQHDSSVNFVWRHRVGSVEARYVRRREDRAIIYLSSKSGCAMRCKMCHLTQSGQSQAINLTLDETLHQAETVLRYLQEAVEGGAIAPIVGVDYSFMARGDFFDNALFIADAPELLRRLHALAARYGFDARVKISTIMPQALRSLSLSAIFGSWTPDLYYSVYSVEDGFRDEWLPRAMTVPQALRILTDWQVESRKIIILHGAFISGENDDPAALAVLGDMVRGYGLRVDWNVVRYNPFSDDHGCETEDLSRCVRALKQAFPESQVNVISRVGPDVFASCGMFVRSE